MNSSTSIALDALRFAAACLVFLSHATHSEFNDALPWVGAGHEAVVAFFVISGFVISYVIDTKERDPLQYAAARLGRLYSVVLPALFLTFALDFFGRGIDAALYSPVPGDSPLLRLLANGFFIQQNWNLTVVPLSNRAFWSLGFEFWYYCIFGAWILAPGGMRWPLTLACCLCAGPRILAFFPIWLLGVAAYKLQKRLAWAPGVRRVGFWISLVAMLGYMGFGNPFPALRPVAFVPKIDWYWEVLNVNIYLGHVQRVPEDFLFGVLVAVGIVTFDLGSGESERTSAVVRTIRYLAGSTFSIYLFHLPLLYFFHALLDVDRTSVSAVMGVSLLALGACLLLSHGTERKQSGYRRFFEQILGRAFVRRQTA